MDKCYKCEYWKDHSKMCPYYHITLKDNYCGYMNTCFNPNKK